MCKEGDRTSDKPLLTKVAIHGVRVDVSDATINRFLHGSAFVPRATSPTFYAGLKHQENQCKWLTTLIANGELKWLNNWQKRLLTRL